MFVQFLRYALVCFTVCLRALKFVAHTWRQCNEQILRLEGGVLEAKGTFPPYYLRLDGGVSDAAGTLRTIRSWKVRFRGKRDYPPAFFTETGGHYHKKHINLHVKTKVKGFRMYFLVYPPPSPENTGTPKSAWINAPLS